MKRQVDIALHLTVDVEEGVQVNKDWTEFSPNTKHGHYQIDTAIEFGDYTVQVVSDPALPRRTLDAARYEAKFDIAAHLYDNDLLYGEPGELKFVANDTARDILRLVLNQLSVTEFAALKEEA